MTTEQTNLAEDNPTQPSLSRNDTPAAEAVNRKNLPDADALGIPSGTARNEVFRQVVDWAGRDGLRSQEMFAVPHSVIASRPELQLPPAAATRHRSGRNRKTRNRSRERTRGRPRPEAHPNPNWGESRKCSRSRRRPNLEKPTDEPAANATSPSNPLEQAIVGAASKMPRQPGDPGCASPTWRTKRGPMRSPHRMQETGEENH